jgi:AraC family transcriptional regulator, regulatory protein of adaptative response / DNA-3-methyladenine glycosylase II
MTPFFEPYLICGSIKRGKWEADGRRAHYVRPMTEEAKYPFDRALAQAGRYDGKFIVGVLSTGIYCLPSCRARPPKPENVRLFKTEDEAKNAGLRACKRCRPDLYYRGENSDLSLFEGLAARVRKNPEKFDDTASLAAAAGVSQTKLGELMRDHAHMTPAAWLRRERVKSACRLLFAGVDRIADIGYAVGFESESVFHRQFLAITRMTPGAWRALPDASVFVLHLPAGWRADEVLAYHGRDPESRCERVDGNRLFKALLTQDGPVALEIALERESAWCRVHAGRTLGAETMEQAQTAALRMLGLMGDVASFESRAARDPALAKLLGRRRGLRVPMTATPFDALMWAIIGQQINVKFAAALRREMLALAGHEVDGMIAHPSAEEVARLDAKELTTRRFSGSKAEYVVHAAREVTQGNLAVDALGEGSAIAAEKSLKNIRGIGTWTARYMLLRGAGFADCAPVGDSALATALQRLHGLDERPSHDNVHDLMADYAPHRSLATCHLWASLKEVA